MTPGGDSGIASLAVNGRGRHFFMRETTLADSLAALVAAALLAATLASMRSSMTYDEAVYLSLAREITSSGLPKRLDFNDLQQLHVFETSPPLVMYVAALTQFLSPGQEMPSRIVQIALFVLPTYALVWWVTRRRFGPWAAAAALLSLLASKEYLLATGHVMLDVPLGLLALAVLVCFDRAAMSDRPGTQRGWAVLAGVTLMLATWTKYQAVCVCAAIGLYFLYLFATSPSRSRVTLRLTMPMVGVIGGGALALGLLVAYFLGFGGASSLNGTLAFNAERMSTGGEGLHTIVREVSGVATHSVWTVGPVLLASALAAWLVQPRERSLVGLLTAYVIATIAFNIFFFRLPGSGSYYLQSAVPAIAVLTGASAAALAEAAPSLRGVAVVLLVAAVQLVGAPPPLSPTPRLPAVRHVAEYIARHEDPGARVLAPTVETEFYTRRRVAAIPYVPADVLLDALTNESPRHVHYVIVEPGKTPPGTERIADQWNEVLRRNFVPAAVEAPGVMVYERSH